jgi:hypothetical protein
MVRLVSASGDYISQYHEETRAAYARAAAVDFEYRRDEYHRHWATSIAETFDFPRPRFWKPVARQHARIIKLFQPLSDFRVWGYRANVVRPAPALSTSKVFTRAGYA